MNILEKITLTKIKGIGPKLSRILLVYNGSVEDIFQSSKKQFLLIPTIREELAENIVSKSYLQEAEEEYHFILKYEIEVAWIEDKNYPKRLMNCDNALVMLYYKGTASLNPPKVISIVGTRNSTTYGKRICEDFIQQLKTFNIQIISSLAYGIDSYAHHESLKNQIPTIGILGHELDRIYPASHRELTLRMLEIGGLLTEFPLKLIPENITMDEKKVYEYIKENELAGIDDISLYCDWPSSKLAIVLFEMEMKSLIVSLTLEKHIN